MDLSEENWLTDEKYDFNLNLSGLSNKSDNDDEEVFFGPLTHKEKCVATIVKEKDIIHVGTRIKPEEQALLLRESALVSLRIKQQGTPGRYTPSAVAIVHPMKRRDDVNDFNTKRDLLQSTGDGESKENMFTSKVQNITQNEFSKPTSLTVFPPKISTSLKTAKGVPPKLQKLQCPPRKSLSRKSGLPTTTHKSGMVKSKSGGGIPSILPSALPSKQSIGNNTTKTLKTTTQSLSGISSLGMKPQQRLPTKNFVSTPLDNKKSKDKPSQKQLQNSNKATRHSIGTPSYGKATATKIEKVKKQSELVTPVIGASSRKSIVGRQLVPKKDNRRSPSPAERVKSSSHIVEPDKTADVQHVPSHSDILEKYKILCRSKSDLCLPKESNEIICTDIKLENNKKVIKDQSDELLIQPTNLNVENMNKEHKLPENNVTVYTQLPNADVIYKNNDKHIHTEVMIDMVPEPNLIDICDSSETELSPVKTKENVLDPFETGNTPPPLIQLDIILEPERPREVNLIEF